MGAGAGTNFLSTISVGAKWWLSEHFGVGLRYNYAALGYLATTEDLQSGAAELSVRSHPAGHHAFASL